MPPAQVLAAATSVAAAIALPSAASGARSCSSLCPGASLCPAADAAVPHSPSRSNATSRILAVRCDALHRGSVSQSSLQISGKLILVRFGKKGRHKCERGHSSRWPLPGTWCWRGLDAQAWRHAAVFRDACVLATRPAPPRSNAGPLRASCLPACPAPVTACSAL